MATLAKLIVSIGASTAEFEAAIKQTSTHLKNFQRDTKALEPLFSAIGTTIRVVGTAMIGAFVGGGTAALASGQIIEKYRMSLTTLMGSSKAAGEAIANALNLSSKTPFTDDQLLAATVALQKFGQEAKTVLPQVADMAAATNGDVEQAAEAFGAFLQGRVKALASYGITKAAVLAEGAATEQGIQIANQKGQIVNEGAYSRALLSLMDKRFKEGAELQANSLGGLIKGMKDTGEDILRTIAGFSDDGTVRAGSMFDFFKQGITAVLAKVEEWKANGSLQKWAIDVGQAITVFFENAKIVFNWLVDIATWIAKNWNAIIPVIGGVIGAFVAFKTVTAYVDIAAVAVKLFGASVTGALGPLGLILIATTALAAALTHLIQKQQQANALLNPSLAGLASAEHITALTAAMTEYDAVTGRMGLAMTDAGQDATAYYASRVAGHQKYVKEIKEQNDLMAKAALASRNATAKATEETLRGQEAKIVTSAITTAAAVTKASTSAAAAVTKASTSATDAIAKANADLANKNYVLTHTELQNKLHAIDLEAAADLEAGGGKLLVAQWVANSRKEIYADAAKEQKDADKKAQDEYLDSLAAYVSKQKDVYSAVAQIISDNYSVEKTTAVNALNAERDATVNALDDMIDKRQDVLSSTLDALSEGETAAINAINAERDATVNALDDMITKRQDALSLTLDAISQEKDAALGQYDAEIQALEDAHEAGQRVDTIAGLQSDIATAQHDIVFAETAVSRIAAQKALNDAKTALDKEMNTESYNDRIASLQKQKKAASDTYDAETTAAKKAGDAEIQSLKDTVAAAKTSYAAQISYMNTYYTAEIAAVTKSGNVEIQQLKDAETALQKSMAGRLVYINTYYDQKMATANINADAEKLLATLTSDQIFAMLLEKLPEYANLGAEYGNALYSNVLAAQGAITALQQTAVNVQPNGKAPAGLSVGTTVKTNGGDFLITAVNPNGSYVSVPATTVSPTWDQGAGQAGYGRILMTHANGGYFSTPHIAQIAESGPEWVVPQSQASSFANQMGGSDTAAQLRQLGLKLDTLIFTTRQVAPGVGSVINGLGRA